MNCPSCGRPTPPGNTCVHCGATLAPARRLPLGIIKWAVVLFAAGAQIRVTGLIQEYQGALEIVPQIGFDVIVTP